MKVDDRRPSQDPIHQGRKKYENLMEVARSLGVSDVKLFGVERIAIEDTFRKHCEEPRCPNYGSSVHCPPHAMMPQDFRELLKGYAHVLGFKFDFPLQAVQGAQRVESSRLLHETTAGVEHHAKLLGFGRARGFSSGGCKNTFCDAFETCAALEEGGTCRFPDRARTSLSCVGVNFHELSKSLGWRMWKNESGETDDAAGTVMMVGLVLCE